MFQEIPLRNTKITDEFWKPSIDLVRESIIPYQWEILNDLVKDAEPSHCLHNFKVAAKEEEGDFMGAVFQDTDVAKWLEAVAYTLEAFPDEELERLADETIALIGRAQQEDGYLDTYFIIKEPEGRFRNLQEGHELYTAGHMIEAAVAYYQATGKDEFLKIVCKTADLLCDTFGPEADQIHGYPGHQEIELALVRLYRVTGRRQYLELAKYFIDIRGVGANYFLEEQKRRGGRGIFPEFSGYDPAYSQSHMPVRDQKTAEGHAVRAVYMYCAMADLALEYGDEALMDACKTLWDNMTGKRMYLTGGIGSSGILERFTTDYDLPNDRNYSETCASIGLALFGSRMARITKDASYMDTVELELYNNILAGIAMDGKSFFYVNPLEVWPDNCMNRTSMEHVKPVRQKWFGVACCPPNIARTLASLGHYIAFREEKRVYVNLYVSTVIDGILEDPEDRLNPEHTQNSKGSLKIESQMPWKGRCEITRGGGGGKEMELALRIPAYAEGFAITGRDGRPVRWHEETGYAVLDEDGGYDPVILTWNMPAAYVWANPMVRADAGRVAVKKGPVVYCLEETDNGANLAGVFADTSQPPAETWEPDLLGGVVSVSIHGKRLSAGAPQEKKLYAAERPQLKDVSLKAVPYARWCNRTPGEMTVWMKELYHV